MERGTVRMRVAFVLRSAEVQPLFRDLCRRRAASVCARIVLADDTCISVPPVANSTPPRLSIIPLL